MVRAALSELRVFTFWYVVPVLALSGVGLWATRSDPAEVNTEVQGYRWAALAIFGASYAAWLRWNEWVQRMEDLWSEVPKGSSRAWRDVLYGMNADALAMASSVGTLLALYLVSVFLVDRTLLTAGLDDLRICIGLTGGAVLIATWLWLAS